MSFHLSAESITVIDNHILQASLRDENGDLQESSIDLNNFIGNVDGAFLWDGENFSDTAQNVHFAIEGGGEVPVLRGDLQNADGEWISRDLNLSERIVNNNGSFEFQ